MRRSTIAKITSLLYFLGWSGWRISPEVWTIIMLSAVVLIGGVMRLTRGDVAYAGVLIWAFIGIAIKHEDTATVATAAWLAAALTTVLLIISAYRHRRKTINVVLTTS